MSLHPQAIEPVPKRTMPPLLWASLRVRRWLYAACLGAVLIAGMAAALWSAHGSPNRVPAVELVVAGIVAAAVGALLWLRPRPLPYALGLLCLLLALLGLWLASPLGWWVTSTQLLHWPYERFAGWQRFGVLMLLFPVAWVLLAASVTDFRIGLLSYLVPGVTFLLMIAGSGAFHSPGPSPLLLFAFPLLWPVYTLMMLGLFGFSFG